MRGLVKLLRQEVTINAKNLAYRVRSFKIAQVGPRDMLNNFCFHVLTQKSLIIAENGNAFLGPQPHPVIVI